MSFGTIGKILDAHFNGKKVFTEFNNYLIRKNSFKIGKLIKNIKLKLKIDFLQLRINAASHIYEYYENRVNKRKKKLDNNSWIKNYLNYRISNEKNNIFFSKIRIYL